MEEATRAAHDLALERRRAELLRRLKEPTPEERAQIERAWKEGAASAPTDEEHKAICWRVFGQGVRPKSDFLVLPREN